MGTALTKKQYVDRICDLVGIKRHELGRGSSMRSWFVKELADLLGVSREGSMPVVAKRIVEATGLHWDAECDSTATDSGGGSTVTDVGTRRLLQAVEAFVGPDLGELSEVELTEEGIGQAYLSASGDVTSIRTTPSNDWSLTAEATREHAETQNAFAEYLQRHGLKALSPRTGDPKFDVGYRASQLSDGLVIVEVKSVRPENMVDQVRKAVGQLLHYAHQIEVRTDEYPTLVLVTSRPITPELKAYCERNGISVFDRQAMEADRAVGVPGLGGEA